MEEEIKIESVGGESGSLIVEASMEGMEEVFNQMHEALTGKPMPKGLEELKESEEWTPSDPLEDRVLDLEAAYEKLASAFKVLETQLSDVITSEVSRKQYLSNKEKSDKEAAEAREIAMEKYHKEREAMHRKVTAELTAPIKTSEVLY